MHTAQTMKSMMQIREEKLEQAQDTLEQSYEKQVKVFKNDRAHPFLEHSLSQLALLYKVNKHFEKAEEMYGNLIKIKELYYGEESESMLTPVKNLAMV